MTSNKLLDDNSEYNSHLGCTDVKFNNFYEKFQNFYNEYKYSIHLYL